MTVFGHAMYSLLKPGCQFPLILGVAEAIISATFFVLFTKFYIDSYKQDAFKLKAN